LSRPLLPAGKSFSSLAGKSPGLFLHSKKPSSILDYSEIPAMHVNKPSYHGGIERDTEENGRKAKSLTQILNEATI